LRLLRLVVSLLRNVWRKEGVAALGLSHDRVVGVSEAVDRLFGVAHDEEASALRQGVLEKGEKVVPLNEGGVLEFVNQEVIDCLADPEIDVRNDFLVKVSARFLLMSSMNTFP